MTLGKENNHGGGRATQKGTKNETFGTSPPHWLLSLDDESNDDDDEEENNDDEGKEKSIYYDVEAKRGSKEHVTPTDIQPSPP